MEEATRQPAGEQAAEPLHVAWPQESRYAVEALLPGAQHRETGAPRLRAVGGCTRRRSSRARDRSQAKVGRGGTADRKLRVAKTKMARTGPRHFFTQKPA